MSPFNAVIRLACFFAAGLLLTCLRPVFGDDAALSFDQANKLYEQGKFPEAIRAYENLLAQKKSSPALFFNLGNAYFKNGQAGQAIASYRMAERIAPRDPDIRANLRFARESVGSTLSELGRWQRSVSLFTLNELAFAAAGALWIWFSILIAGQVRRDLRKPLAVYRMYFGILTALMVLWLGFVARERLSSAPAVVVVREATVRYGPFDEAQKFFTLRDGAELKVLDSKDNWLQVTDPSNRTGWLDRKDVLLLPRG